MRHRRFAFKDLTQFIVPASCQPSIGNFCNHAYWYLIRSKGPIFFNPSPKFLPELPPFPHRGRLYGG